MSVMLAIVLAGIGTYLSRSLFILVLGNYRFPPLALRVLEYVAPAVLGGLIASMLTGADGVAQVGIAEVSGLGAAALVAWRTRNHSYALVAALSVYWLLIGLGL